MTPSPATTRASRIVYVAYIAVTAAFVGSLIVEVAGQVFSPGPPPEALSPECARGMRELYAGIDDGIPAGLGLATSDADRAVAEYRAARDAAWKNRDEVTATCTAEPRGIEALAAIARLDRQAEGVVRRRTLELRAVRRDVDSFIR